MPKQVQLRAFVFTLNNYTPEEVEEVKAYSGFCRYLVFGFETAPSTGTPHLQGYAQLIKRTDRNKISKKFPRMFIDRAMGKPEEASAYCKKGGLFEEFGTLATAESGGDIEKQRWHTILKMIRERDIETLMDDYPKEYLQLYNTIQKIHKDNPPEVTDMPRLTGLWIHGPSGVGKSRGIREIFAHHNMPFYDKACNKWWDGYKDEPAVLIDDFDPTHKVLFHYLKRWTDHYAFRAEVKNSALYIRPNLIVITSQYSIDEIWDDEPTREAMWRRCQVVHLLDEKCCLEWKDEQKKQKIEFTHKFSRH